MTLMT